jgi:hypothetical protein
LHDVGGFFVIVTISKRILRTLAVLVMVAAGVAV